MNRQTPSARPVVPLLAVALAIASLVPAGCAPVASPPAATAETSPAPVTLNISAAASLKDALESLEPDYEAENGVDLVYNFAASGVLQKQIESGAAADVFMSAAPKQMNALVDGGFVSNESTRTFASNDIVIAVPKGNPAAITGPGDLAKAKRLATGNPESAPHGTWSKGWLVSQGLWDSLESTFVFGESAGQTTDYVARGEVDAALIFASEINGREDVEIAYTVPAEQIDPVAYVIAPLVATPVPDAAESFIGHIMSDAGHQMLLDHGFASVSGGQ